MGGVVDVFGGVVVEVLVELLVGAAFGVAWGEDCEYEEALEVEVFDRWPCGLGFDLPGELA